MVIVKLCEGSFTALSATLSSYPSVMQPLYTLLCFTESLLLKQWVDLAASWNITDDIDGGWYESEGTYLTVRVHVWEGAGAAGCGSLYGGAGEGVGGVEGGVAQQPEQCCAVLHWFHNRLYNHGEGPY